jgi:hypothetical protein
VFYQDFQNLQGLALQSELQTVFAELPDTQIKLKSAEADYIARWDGNGHGYLTKVQEAYHTSGTGFVTQPMSANSHSHSGLRMDAERICNGDQRD